MKKLSISLAVLALVLLTGCGHNALVYSDGIGFDAGLDPEHFSASFNLRYGKILTVAVRDCVEMEMNGEASGGADTGTPATSSATTTAGVKLKIGRQINGYTRDLIEAGADAEQIRALLESTSNLP